MEEAFRDVNKGYEFDTRQFLQFLVDTGRADASVPIEVSPEDLAAVGASDINEFQEYLKSRNPRLSDNSLAHRLMAIRAYYDRYLEQGLLNGSNPVDLADWPRRKQRKRPVISEKEIYLFFETIREDTAFSGKKLEIHRREKLRDEALFRLLVFNSCKTENISFMDLDDVSGLSDGTIMIPSGQEAQTARIREKVSRETAEALEKYIKTGREGFKPLEECENALFLSRKHNRMSMRTVQYTANQYLTLAFGEDKPVTLYDLKRFARGEKGYNTIVFRKGDVEKT